MSATSMKGGRLIERLSNKRTISLNIVRLPEVMIMAWNLLHHSFTNNGLVLQK